MSTNRYSSSTRRFAALYDALPSDAQQALTEKHLIPLLNSVPKSKSRKVLRVAARLHQRHAKIPDLNIKAKKIEVTDLLEEYQRDAKQSFFHERRNKGELLNETISSLVDWLNDIWSVVCEHRVAYSTAHSCLLFVATTLVQINNIRNGCKCAFDNIYISVTIRKKGGKTVKSFDIQSSQNIEEALQYIWREMFLTILAYGNQRQKKLIPSMLNEIQDLMGWNNLQRVLYGGKKCPHDVGDDDDVDGIDSDEDLDYEDDESEAMEDDDSLHYGRHWPLRISSQMPNLRMHILATMTSIFERRPSSSLYTAIVTLSSDPETTQAQLLKLIGSMATSCSDAFSAALDIYALESNAKATIALLTSHSHLLRPRDAPSLQKAVSILARNGYALRASQILEKELLEIARTIRNALLPSFSLVDSKENQDELLQILRLRSGAAGRQDRVERYVDSITTPGANQPNPMAFAAMMMGIPMMPGMDPADENDHMAFLDFDPSDPDLDEVREEFRPKLKQRFESWVDTAIVIKGGSGILLKVYKELIETMPFLRATDAVEEMISRLADKPSKHYVCDALDALSAFSKVQRRKVNLAIAEKKRRNAATNTTAPGASGSATSTVTSTPATPTPATTNPAAPTPAAPTPAAPAPAPPTPAPPTPAPHTSAQPPGYANHPFPFLTGIVFAGVPAPPGPGIEDVD